jgi:hypothetical protein
MVQQRTALQCCDLGGQLVIDAIVQVGHTGSVAGTQRADKAQLTDGPVPTTPTGPHPEKQILDFVTSRAEPTIVEAAPDTDSRSLFRYEQRRVQSVRLTLASQSGLRDSQSGGGAQPQRLLPPD